MRTLEHTEKSTLVVDKVLSGEVHLYNQTQQTNAESDMGTHGDGKGQGSPKNEGSGGDAASTYTCE